MFRHGTSGTFVRPFVAFNFNVDRESIVDLRRWRRRDDGGNNYVYGRRCDRSRRYVRASYTLNCIYAYVSNRVSEWSILCVGSILRSSFYILNVSPSFAVWFRCSFFFFLSNVDCAQVRPQNRALMLFDIHQKTLTRFVVVHNVRVHYTYIVAPARSSRGPSESRRSSSARTFCRRCFGNHRVQCKAYLNYKMEITSELYCSTLTSE